MIQKFRGMYVCFHIISNKKFFVSPFYQPQGLVTLVARARLASVQTEGTSLVLVKTLRFIYGRSESPKIQVGERRVNLL